MMHITSLLLLLAAIYVGVRVAMVIAKRFYGWQAVGIGIVLIVFAGIMHYSINWVNVLVLLSTDQAFSPVEGAVYWLHVVLLVAGWACPICIGWIFGRRVRGA